MAGTFTTRRRKARGNPRPDGQSSQSGVLRALGLIPARVSPHQGSKPGYKHLTLRGPLDAYGRAQEWQIATGRPLPPQMRPRQPLPPPEPLGLRDRAANYLDAAPPLGHPPAAALLDSPRLTPAQRRRLLHKAGQHGERPAGYASAASAADARRAARSRARRTGPAAVFVRTRCATAAGPYHPPGSCDACAQPPDFAALEGGA